MIKTLDELQEQLVDEFDRTGENNLDVDVAELTNMALKAIGRYTAVAAKSEGPGWTRELSLLCAIFADGFMLGVAHAKQSA